MSQIYDWLGTTRQAHYQHKKRQEEKVAKDEELLAEVRLIRQKHPRMGVRKLQAELSLKGVKVGRDALFSLLRAHQMLVKRVRGPRTTFPGKIRYPNLLAEVEVTQPDEAWVTDITYVRTEEGFLYLALITDLFSRKIVGYDLSRSLSADGAMRALQMAISQTNRPLKGLIHHSDHGIQYTCHAYQELLKESKIECSMGEVGNCYDNAVAERVNGILKIEYLLDSLFLSLDQCQKAVQQAVWLYNHERPHLALGYAKPHHVYIHHGNSAFH